MHLHFRITQGAHSPESPITDIIHVCISHERGAYTIKANANILAADIGGTNSRFAHFTLEGDTLALRESVWLMTSQAGSFPGLIKQLWESDIPLAPKEVDLSVLAVAGPVLGGTYANPPAIEWDIDLAEGSPEGLSRCTLINDFAAQAWACMSPVASEAEIVLPGATGGSGTMAVLGAGTGFGKAALVPDGMGGYAAMPSEGGHVAFPFNSGREEEFREFMLREIGKNPLVINDIVSGGGIARLHRFLAGEDVPPEEMPGRLADIPETLEWAARFYGRAARDFALETLALGGLYIAGGVAARTPELVRHGAFRDEFVNSPALGGLLAQVPVYLQKNQESGLWGAAEFAKYELRREVI